MEINHSLFADSVISAYREKGLDVFAEFDARLIEFNAVWNQDSERIGRVLRAHLAVEHFLTEYLGVIGPKLAIDDARLSFSQKIDLLGTAGPMGANLAAGLRRLNVIRNRMAHKLRVDINQEDGDVFLALPLFSAMRKAGQQHRGEAASDPLSVLEQFAQFAAGMLHSACDPNQDIWMDAVASALEKSQTSGS